jgi:hypothetical protein
MSKVQSKTKARCLWCDKAAKNARFCTECGALIPDAEKSAALSSAIKRYRIVVRDPRMPPDQRVMTRAFLDELEALTKTTARDAASARAATAMKSAAPARGVVKGNQQPTVAKAAAETDPVLDDLHLMTYSKDPAEREAAFAALGTFTSAR